ncbi:hypothetical protein K437DRAFT_294168 [Tilletiaria anomala UBC 951]|uniref:Cytoplasmic protein n=1 Tax=Tilletiaria anomala (strain ATCC 24038 / CBS 436.72 / UBC 951) TaxID=1037660 RepID=A0A066VZ27_TILAU|nr:uncharacterized protein K437DRAFT_294168 [Tilletiaria anomala UBC 951]KDN46972.1 hypothetical protein K437DRAFT_294168 [Tilletiaria anomala UBC 951]
MEANESEREVSAATAAFACPPVPVVEDKDPASTEAGSQAQGEGETPAHLLPGGFHAFNPAYGDDSTPVTNLQRPKTDAVITIRVIKSFEYRTMKALVLKAVDLTTMTVGELKQRCRQEITATPAFKAFRSSVNSLDTIKVYTRAHGSKTTNLIINLDHPEWILDDNSKTLEAYGFENEAEASFFNRDAYEAFLKHPETKWA